jgi:hypothetical protein
MGVEIQNHNTITDPLEQGWLDIFDNSNSGGGYIIDQTILLLLPHNVSLDRHTHYGDTALAWDARYSHNEITEILLA